MQVSFNTNNYAYQYKYNNRNYTAQNSTFKKTQNNPAFTGWFGLPSSSKFLEPLSKQFDKLTDFIAKHYTKPLYESKVAKWLSRQDSVGQIVNHMQMLGSIIVSGMYMGMTLRNKNMDDETKKKLSINQGLTWVAATLGAYGLDAALDKAWDRKVSLKYATNFLYDPEDKKYASKKDLYNDLLKGLKEHNKKLEADFYADPKNLKSGIFGKKKFKPVLATQYLSKRFENAALTTDLKGLDVLKSLMVFGTIYRFVSPVLVTPIANIIGDKLFATNSLKNNETDKKEQDTMLLAQTTILNKPKMSQFAGGFKKSA